MPLYKVKLTFKYSDIVHVKAEDRKEAVSKALEGCQEEYECFYDAEILRELECDINEKPTVPTRIS